MPYSAKPPVTKPLEGAEAEKKPEAKKKDPEQPKDAERQTEAGHQEVTKRQKDYRVAVDKMRDQLTRIINQEAPEGIERKAALDDLAVFIGKLSTQLDNYEAGQRAKFKVTQKIGKLFKIQVAQQYLVGAEENTPESKAEPYKLEFKVAIEPLGVTLGVEQYEEGEKPMAFKPKQKRYLEVIVYEGGKTKVKLRYAATTKRDKGETTVKYTPTVKGSFGDIYLETGLDLKPDEGMSPGSAYLVASGVLKKDRDGNPIIRAGTTVAMSDVTAPEKGVSIQAGVFGTFDAL